jgi:hypothetical protein
MENDRQRQLSFQSMNELFEVIQVPAEPIPDDENQRDSGDDQTSR